MPGMLQIEVKAEIADAIRKNLIAHDDQSLDNASSSAGDIFRAVAIKARDLALGTVPECLVPADSFARRHGLGPEHAQPCMIYAPQFEGRHLSDDARDSIRTTLARIHGVVNVGFSGVSKSGVVLIAPPPLLEMPAEPQPEAAAPVAPGRRVFGARGWPLRRAGQ